MIPLPDLFRYWAKFRPNDEALVCEDTRYSWHALLIAGEAVAAHLQQRGVQPGDRVGVLLPNSAEWAVAYVGLTLAGAVLVPLNSRFGSFELRAIADDANCAALITTPEVGQPLGDRFAIGDGDEAAIVVASPMRHGAAPASFEAVIASGAVMPPVRVDPDSLAAIFYTSGSTGLPKGTMQTHTSIAAFLMGYILPLQFTSSERALIVAPLAFTGACLSLLIPMLAIGACAVIERTLDAERALRLIEAERISFMTMVPAIWERLPQLPGWRDADLSSLRVAMTGGAPVSLALLETYRAKGVGIRQVYGCTELGAMGCTSPPLEHALAHPESVGFPQVTLEMRIVKDGADCGVGEAGELWVRGPQVMRGYWNAPEQTAAAIDGDGWFRTGDLLCRNTDGTLRMVDRLKNMIISGGVNVYPAEIERALATIDGVIESGVFGLPDAQWGERVVAMIHYDADADLNTVRGAARDLLGPLKSPREYVRCPDPLPKTVTNKIARHELPTLYAQMAHH